MTGPAQPALLKARTQRTRESQDRVRWDADRVLRQTAERTKKERDDECLELFWMLCLGENIGWQQEALRQEIDAIENSMHNRLSASAEELRMDSERIPVNTKFGTFVMSLGTLRHLQETKPDLFDRLEFTLN